MDDRSGGPRPPGGRAAAAPDAADERQRTIDLLCEAFANDELEVEEFERRVEAAHRAQGADELRRLLGGLATARVPVPASSQQNRPAARATPQAPAPYRGDVREWSLAVGVMGGSVRKGFWVPARQNVAFALMGGCELDLREAELPPGVTEIYAGAFWGGIEIIVPPWVRLETSGIGIMGGFEATHDVPPPSSPDAPIVRVSGFAIMAGVEVSVRYPGESGRDARRRVKEDRKARRLGGKRNHGEDDL